MPLIGTHLSIPWQAFLRDHRGSSLKHGTPTPLQAGNNSTRHFAPSCIKPLSSSRLPYYVLTQISWAVQPWPELSLQHQPTNKPPQDLIVSHQKRLRVFNV